MPKPGIKVLEDMPGSGPPIQKGDRVKLCYDIALNRGDVLFQNQEAVWTVGDRTFVAGFRYGLEGMRVGGSRKFKASSHLCYRDEEMAGVPASAVLVVTIKKLELTNQKDEK
jgi:FKBP-type peptidyl-prolyl cis-trans isomerase